MSNIKSFIDYTLDDSGHAARDALYADIHDRVMAHIEAKKIELAGGMLTRESKYIDISVEEELQRLENKIYRLKEELSLMEASKCDMEDDDDEDEDEEYEKKKKKLKKAKKKLKKLKESIGSSEHELEESWDDDDDDVARADRELKRMKAKPISADKKTDPDKEISKLAKKTPKEMDEEVEQIDEISSGKLKSYVKKASKVNSQLAGAALRDVGTPR